MFRRANASRPIIAQKPWRPGICACPLAQAAAFGSPKARPRLLRVERRPIQRPLVHHARDPIPLLRGGRSLATHRFDLHQSCRRASRCRIFSRSSSLLTAWSATTRFEPLRFFIVDVGLPALQMRFAARQELVTPRRQFGRRHAMSAAQALQVGAAQQLEDHRDLALGRPPYRLCQPWMTGSWVRRLPDR